jgi:alkylhydroperoxidase family enzyme
MIQRLIQAQLAREERRLGSSLDYLRHIARVSLPAFLKFGAFTPLARHRRVLPAEPYHVARLVSTQLEDCGTCVQIEVNLARQSGVAPELIQAVLNQAPELLPSSLEDVYRFAEAVVTHTGDEGETRERLRHQLGEEGLVELALAIAACRVFPTTKRALGYAISCERVEIRV